MISHKLIDEVKELFKRKYGVEYSDDEAREAAQNLVNYFDLLLSIDQRNKKEHEKEQKAQD